MTRLDPADRARFMSSQMSRRSILQTGSATLAIAAAASSPGTAWAAQAAPATPVPHAMLDADAIDQFAADAMQTYDVPGAAMAVVQGGRPVLIKGYGVRDLGASDAVDADTVFQLASNTKSMTAFTLGTLVEEGMLDWDTPISEIMPELQLWDPYPTRWLTIRDTLSHRSGFPAFGADLLSQIGHDRAEVLRRIRYLPPASSFRSVAAYSNVGFFIAGEVIARLTGLHWEEAMHTRMFEPLGMSRSGASLADRPTDGNMSANHGVVDGRMQTVPADDHGVSGAAGSAISTANDLALWMQMLLDEGLVGDRQVMRPDTVREMFVPSMVAEATLAELPPIDATSGFSFTMGWANFHYHGHEVMGKSGALDGIRSTVVLVPALNAGVAVVANRNLTALPEAIRAFVLEQLLGSGDGDVQQAIKETGDAIELAFAQRPTLPAQSVPLSVPIEALAGDYENTLYGTSAIVEDDGNLRLEAGPDKKPASLTHFNHTTFLLDWGSVTSIPSLVTFVVGPEGEAIAFEEEAMGRFERTSAG